jgi:hypothetical protein
MLDGWGRRGVAVLLVITAAGSTAADSASIEASRDATLIEDPAGALATGSGPHFFAGRNSQGKARRGTILFDVAAAIPPHAEILSVVLRLHMSQTSGGPARVSVHRVAAPWGEAGSSSSGGSGAPPQPGDATWIHTFHDHGFWALPGGDFVASSASTVIDQPGFYEFGPTPELAADVRAWLADPRANHGWLLRGDEAVAGTAKRFDSRENRDLALRPVLIVEFERRLDDEYLPGEGGLRPVRPTR